MCEEPVYTKTKKKENKLATESGLLSVKDLAVVVDEKSGKVVEVSHAGERGLTFRPQ